MTLVAAIRTLNGLAAIAGAAYSDRRTAAQLLAMKVHDDRTLQNLLFNGYTGGFIEDEDLDTIQKYPGWLSDPVIDGYMNLVQISEQIGGLSVAPSILCLSSHLIPKALQEDDQLRKERETVEKLNSKEACLKQEGAQLTKEEIQKRELALKRIQELSSDRVKFVRRWILNKILPETTHVLVPVNPSEVHWCLIILALKEHWRGMYYFDPFQPSYVDNKATKCMQSLLITCAEYDSAFDGPWPVTCPDAQGVIQAQCDGSSCGIIMLIFAEFVARGFIVLGPGRQCTWSSAAADLLGREDSEVPPLSNSMLLPLRNAMLRLFRELKNRIRGHVDLT